MIGEQQSIAVFSISKIILLELRKCSQNSVLLRSTTLFLCDGRRVERKADHDIIDDHRRNDNDDKGVYNSMLNNYSNENKSIETNIISILIIKSESHNKILSIISISLLKKLLEYTNILDISYLFEKEKNTLLFPIKYGDEFMDGRHDEIENYDNKNGIENSKIRHNADEKYLNHFKIIENDRSLCSMNNTRKNEIYVYKLCEDVLLYNKEFSNNNNDTDNCENLNVNDKRKINIDNNDNGSDDDYNNGNNGHYSQNCVSTSFLNKFVNDAAAHMIKRLQNYLFGLIRTSSTFSNDSTDVRMYSTLSDSTDVRTCSTFSDGHVDTNNDNKNGNDDNDGNTDTRDRDFNNCNDNDNGDKNSEIICFLLSELSNFLDLKFEEQISITSLMSEIVCILCSLIVYDDVHSYYCNDDQNDIGVKYCNKEKHVDHKSVSNKSNKNYEILIKIIEELIATQKKTKIEVIKIHDYETKMRIVYDIFSHTSNSNNNNKTQKLKSDITPIKNIPPIKDSIIFLLKNIEKNYNFISTESNINKRVLESYMIINECIKEFIGFIYGMNELKLLLKTTLNYSNLIHDNTNINMGISKNKLNRYKNSVASIRFTNKLENIEHSNVFIATANESNKNKFENINVDNINTYDMNSKSEFKTIDDSQENRNGSNKSIDDNYNIYPISVPHTPDRLSPHSIRDYDSEDDDIYDLKYKKINSVDKKESFKEMYEVCPAYGDDDDKENKEETFLIECNILYEELMNMHVKI